MLVNFFSPFLLIFQVTNKKGEMARAFTCLCAAAVVAGVALPSPSSFPPDDEIVWLVDGCKRPTLRFLAVPVGSDGRTP